MRMTGDGSREGCHVIPFVRPKLNDEKIVTSSIAAVIAVTILHQEHETPEERLLNIIDSSQETEILDIENLSQEFEMLSNKEITISRPANDNQA